jgi:glutathione peroxidase
MSTSESARRLDGMTTIHEFSATSIDGIERQLVDYKGKVVLVVNTASQCGFTGQYKGLEELYRTYADRGLVVLGFPCDQFGHQEPGDEEEIATFCERNFGVTFPLFSKIDVNGSGRHPLYEWLTAQTTAPDGPGDITWNFAKFVIDRDGNVAARFSPPTKPSDPELRGAVEKAIGSSPSHK